LRARCAGLALGLTLLTAILDEWHQSFDPARTSSARDVGLDMAGGVVFLILALFVFRLWREVRITEMNTASA
jgi:VanZ family protein